MVRAERRSVSIGLGHGGGVGKEGGTRCSRFQASWGLDRPSKAVPSLGAKMLLPGAKVGDEDGARCVSWAGSPSALCRADERVRAMEWM